MMNTVSTIPSLPTLPHSLPRMRCMPNIAVRFLSSCRALQRLGNYITHLHPIHPFVKVGASTFSIRHFPPKTWSRLSCPLLPVEERLSLRQILRRPELQFLILPR